MRTMLMALSGIAIAVAACYNPDVPAQSPQTNPLDEAPPANTTTTAPAAGDDHVEAKKGAFDETEAKIVLNRAAASAHTCVDVADANQPHGDATVSITFSGAGRSIKATIPPPYDGTAIGQCATRAFEGLIVPPFAGDNVTVDQPVDLKPGKSAAAKGATGGKKK